MGESTDGSRRRLGVHDQRLGPEASAQMAGLLATLVGAAPVGFALLDTDLRFVVVNDALAQINGVAADDHLGRTIEDVVPSLDDDAVRSFARVLETGEPLLELELEGETRASPGVRRTWSESVYRVEVDGAVLGVAAIVVETTDRRREEQRSRQIIDALASFVGLLDLDGNVVGANHHALSLAGVSEDGVIGRPFWETPWWSHDPQVQSELRAAVAQVSQGSSVRFDAPVRVADGRIETFDFQMVPLYQDGQITGLVPSGLDVTERRSAAARLLALADYARALAVAEDTSTVAGAVLAHLPTALDAQFANLAIVDREGTGVDFVHPPTMPPEIAARYARSLIAERTPLTDAVREGRLLIVRDLDDCAARYPDLVDDTAAAGLVATASVPLEVDGDVLGALGLGWTAPLIEDDVVSARLLVAAELASQAIRRARTADARELLVSELQSHLLPAVATDGSFEVAVRYLPAGHSIGFGGDWYDLIPLDDDRVALVVGDVAGHGIEAAARMAVLRTMLSTLIRTEAPLDGLFDTVEELVAHLDEPFLGTAAVAIVDPRREVVSHASAGHPPMVLKRASGPAVLLEDGIRPVLGFGAGGACSASAHLPPGSLLVAYTDGLIEHRREHFDVAIARVTALVEADEASSLGVDQIADRILDELGDPTELQDDVALAVLRTGRDARSGGGAPATMAD